MPNGDTIQSSYTGELNYKAKVACQRVHVFDSLWGSLLGIGELCDAELTAVFTKEAVYIVDTAEDTVILTGHRDTITRLWMIALEPITNSQEQQAITTAHQNKQSTQQKLLTANKASAQPLDTAGDRVEFFSRTFCSPVESTLINAVQKRWIKYPGITANILKRHRKRLRTHESAAGHLDQAHQNHHRRQLVPTTTPKKDTDLQPINVITYVHEEGNHMDGTGRYVAVSHRGHQYILVLRSEGGNYIKLIPMVNRLKQSYLKAHQEAMTFFEARGYAPTFQRMDNEISNDFMHYLQEKNIRIDLVPPHQHRRNKAERDIRTFKNHFIAAMAGVDPSFPMHAWNELLEHIEITLNLLRPSVAHPRMSAWEALNGEYDYDAHPLAPPGMAITIHEKPGQRKSWSKHGVKGFYLGPVLDGYRCYNVWTEDKQSTRHTDTVAWHPCGYTLPQYSPLEMVTETVDVMAKALHHLATSDTITAAQRQPVTNIAHEIESQFTALRHIYELPEASGPATQRVPATVLDSSSIQRVPDAAANQRVPQHAKATPPSTPASPQLSRRRSRRQKHKWLNRTNAAAYRDLLEAADDNQRRILMIAKRFNGKNPATPPEVVRNPKRYTNQAIKQAHKKLIRKLTSWSHWKTMPGVELDSNGIPFFLSNQKSGCFANTAADLDEKGKKLSMTTALASPEGLIWLTKHGEEIARLFDSETIRLIKWNELPPEKKAAYYNPQVQTKMKEGALQYRVRGTIGGDKIDYAGETAAHTASMQLIKILLNSVVSTPGAKFMTADIKDFYLGTPLPNTEYMRIQLAHIPQDIIAKYHMNEYEHNGAVLVAVHKGIYGLPQAGKLAQDRLVEHLAKHGYHQAANTPCLFKHDSNSVSFTLVVDDFGIKYTKAEDADHLLTVLRKLYIMTEDRAQSQKYVGITIEHDRITNTIMLSMPGYVEKAITRFGHAKRPGAKTPLTYIPPKFGSAQQETTPPPPEACEYVDATLKTFVQEVTGVFLFYSRAVDPTMLTAVNKISMEQAKPTVATLAAVDRLLSYAERYPMAKVVIKPSNMQLCAQSDASYHSESGARSRAGGILYFGQHADGAINGAIDYISLVIPTVCSSAAEAEYAALFLVGREATYARHILEDLGHPQGIITIICDNSCAVGIANDEVKQKRSKAIDMRYHWIRDQVRQQKFTVVWEKGSTNLADYFTKAHPVAHYVSMRRTYVVTPKATSIKECARSRRIIQINTTP